MNGIRHLGRFRVNGARGVTLLGFAVMSGGFAVSFLAGKLLGPLAIYPPPPRGLAILENLGGLPLWSIGWLVAAVWLIVGAFRDDQAKALASFAFMTFIWGTAYAWAFVEDMVTRGASGYWLSALLFYGLLVACLGLARLLNAPPLRVDELKRRLRAVDPDAGEAPTNGD
jgi:hypothetical protein